MSGYDKIPKVNDQNEVIGETTIVEAVANGWYRRVVRVFLFDENGSLLLQKRSVQMPSFPGLWDQSAAGHVDVGESEPEAASRELKEELGITGLELIEIVGGYRNGHGNEKTFDHVYKGMVPRNTEFLIDDREVGEIKWFSVSEFERLLEERPYGFVPPFVSVWENFKAELLK